MTVRAVAGFDSYDCEDALIDVADIGQDISNDIGQGIDQCDCFDYYVSADRDRDRDSDRNSSLKEWTIQDIERIIKSSTNPIGKVTNI
jgi:hypothetical protein